MTMTEAIASFPLGGIASMTGYARTSGSHGALSWAWEAKSVNGRGLDLRLRLPNGLDRLDIPAREALQAALKRGSVSTQLEIKRSSTGRAVSIDFDLIDRILAAQDRLRSKVDLSLPRLTDLLQLRGVMDVAEGEAVDEATQAAEDAALLAGLAQLLVQLSQARLAEGARLGALLLAHLAEIERLTQEARRLAALQPQAAAERFRQALARLLGDGVAPVAEDRLPPDRIAAEIALLAVKCDATEELDRLTAHVAQGRDLLAVGGPIGRKLDFLAQEFNREANTLVSKSADIGVTRLGLDLKTAIDQFREQVQNIE